MTLAEKNTEKPFSDKAPPHPGSHTLAPEPAFHNQVSHMLKPEGKSKLHPSSSPTLLALTKATMKHVHQENNLPDDEHPTKKRQTGSVMLCSKWLACPLTTLPGVVRPRANGWSLSFSSGFVPLRTTEHNPSRTASPSSSAGSISLDCKTAWWGYEALGGPLLEVVIAVSKEICCKAAVHYADLFGLHIIHLFGSMDKKEVEEFVGLRF
ncbi:hypothetical protein B0H14DRAFT_2582692 [Mycena olivaceomarginata]|nr:hypothetical protein B0H14DRAFT_2582692 [Mycena olivaceomarginata]